MKEAARRALFQLIHRVLRNPQLSERINRLLLRWAPRVHRRLFQLASQRGRYGRADEPAALPPDQFSAFTASFLELAPVSKPLPPMLRQHGGELEAGAKRLAALAGCELDLQLIAQLRTGSIRQRRSLLVEQELELARSLVRHLHLACYGKYPFPMEENLQLEALAKGERFETLAPRSTASRQHYPLVGIESIP